MFFIASEETYRDGEVIIKEGTSGDWVYVVQSGKVEVSKMVEGKKFIMTILGPGEVFGELGFLGGVTRTATVRAIGETVVGVIDRAHLDKEFNKLSSDFRAILVAVVTRFKQMADRTTQFSSRKANRTEKALSLRYEDQLSLVDAYTENVGGGGLFIKTENPLEPGERFLLTLALPGRSDPMQITCEVAWTRKQEGGADNPAGMGVKFVKITKDDDKTLKKHLSPQA
jgi:uncharacterized protein (TIGR02266 family)